MQWPCTFEDLWYNCDMTKTMRELLTRVETWPKEAQEELAETMRTIESRHAIDDELTTDDWRIIDERVLQKNIAPDEKVEEVFAKYRRA
jgi:hypothetical protein